MKNRNLRFNNNLQRRESNLKENKQMYRNEKVAKVDENYSQIQSIQKRKKILVSTYNKAKIQYKQTQEIIDELTNRDYIQKFLTDDKDKKKYKELKLAEQLLRYKSLGKGSGGIFKPK